MHEEVSGVWTASHHRARSLLGNRDSLSKEIMHHLGAVELVVYGAKSPGTQVLPSYTIADEQMCVFGLFV